MSSYSVGERYWIPDEEHAWLVGTLRDFKNSVLEFTTDKGIRKFRVNDIKQKLDPCGNHLDDFVENLVDLDELSEGAILHHVRNRFVKKYIYTHVGSILVAVNPFENLPIYGERDIRRALEATTSYPHVFVTAATAYNQLRDNQKNQSVLISGESGGMKSNYILYIHSNRQSYSTQLVKRRLPRKSYNFLLMSHRIAKSRAKENLVWRPKSSNRILY